MQPHAANKYFLMQRNKVAKIPISSRRVDSITVRDNILEEILELSSKSNALKETESNSKMENAETIGVLNIMKNLQDEIQVN